jgi:hypothetical protein
MRRYKPQATRTGAAPNLRKGLPQSHNQQRKLLSPPLSDMYNNNTQGAGNTSDWGYDLVTSNIVSHGQPTEKACSP